jgi:hypothetical protein
MDGLDRTGNPKNLSTKKEKSDVAVRQETAVLRDGVEQICG